MHMILTAFVDILLPPTTECSNMLIQNYETLLIMVYRQVGIVATYTDRSVKKFTVDNDKKKKKIYIYIYIYKI